MVEAIEAQTRNFPAHCFNKFGTLIEAEIKLTVEHAELLA